MERKRKVVFRQIIYCLVFIILLMPTGYSQGQSRYTISGNVKDAGTGEALIGATISIKELSGTGVTSNAYGFYSITLPAGNYSITSQYIGYEPVSEQINLKQNTKLDFSLKEKSQQLQEVVVTDKRKDENVTSTQMGVQKLDIKEIKNIPVLFGEKDVLKTMQLLPGIQPVGEGNSGFYVRGGAADQNLILLDEATVYNASHLLGFFSVFNSDAIKDVTVYKGGEPAEYGGRLSSVVDIKMNDGNDKNFGVSGGIGLIASRINVEGPLVKDRGSFTISARRTYADLFLFLSKDTLAKKARLYFYDINAKANYRINDNNRLFLSGYFGKDVLGLGSTYGLDWGNGTGTLRWNHLFNQRLFSNTSLIFSNYNYNVSVDVNNDLNIVSKIQDYNIKQDFQYYLNPDNQMKFGFNSTYYSLVPGAITANNNSFNLTNKNAWENALYFSHEAKLSPKIRTEYGLRLSSFSLLGPVYLYQYDEEGNTVDSTHYAGGKIVKTYVNLEPRVALTYLLPGNSSVKVSYDRNIQNLHLITNSTTSNPTSLWLPSSNNVKPEIADQFSVGYYRNFKNNMYEFSTEVYYKNLQNQIDYKDGAQLNYNENVESQLLYGKGRAYGIEFYLKKNYGRFNGWLSYTLSRSEKQINGINNNKYYPATQDRTHDVSIVGIYNLSPKWTLSGTWVYYTGNAVTFPSGKYMVDGTVLEYYTERNGYRMPSYNRLDLAATWIRKKTEKTESSWTFSIYNAYNRSNAYTITFRTDPDDPTKTQALQTTLFKIIPSVTYNFKF
ncbi:MAG TPA: TonB-dependent receptor [Bacteroidales bacterium]